MVGPVNHVFGSRDINPAPSVAVYFIIGVSASSVQWKLQSKQWPNWILWDGAGKIPEPDRVGLRCELPASGGMGWRLSSLSRAASPGPQEWSCASLIWLSGGPPKYNK